MSSKKSKAARKTGQVVDISQVNLYPNFGISLNGLKFLGKPIFLCFGLYNSEIIEENFRKNSEEFEFAALTESPPLYGDIDVIREMHIGTVTPFVSGMSLGLVLVTDKSKLMNDKHGFIHLEDETLPHWVGGSTGWRNPRIGHLVEDEEGLKVEQEALVSVYNKIFPSFDKVYKIEQVTSPNGFSDSLFKLVDKKILEIFS